jgi:hypothetical protein
MDKSQAFSRDPVEPWRLHDRIAIRTGVGVALIIGDAEQNVRAGLSPPSVCPEQAERCYCNESLNHGVPDCADLLQLKRETPPRDQGWSYLILMR